MYESKLSRSMLFLLAILTPSCFVANSLFARPPQETPAIQAVAFIEPAKLPATSKPAEQMSGAPGDKASPASDGKGSSAATPSRAEMITQLDRAITADTQRLEQARAELNNPDSDYYKAEKVFRESDELLKVKKAELVKATAEEPTKLPELNLAIADLENKWRLARQSFDLSIEKRRTIQEQLAAIEVKLKKNKDAFAQLLGMPSETPETGGATAGSALPIANAAASGPPGAPPAASSTLPAAAPLSPPAALPSSQPAIQSSSQPSTNPAPASSPTMLGSLPGANALLPAEPAAAKPPSKELIKAQAQVEIKRDEASKAEQVAQSITSRIEALDRDIELESKLLAAVRKKADVSYLSFQALDNEYDKTLQDASQREALPGIWAKRREAQAVFKQAREESRERSLRLDELQTQRSALQREALHANDDLEQKQKEVSGAEGEVLRLQNPFSLHNTMQWALDHLPKIGIILLAMLAIRWVTRVSSKRVISVMVMRSSRGTMQEREDRAKTLLSVFRNALSIIVTIGGVLMIFDELGVAIAPLMGGAAIFGLAVAFGAQNLIRDYFYGFVILIENQYKLNDVLKIGDLSGQVEQITLRMTVLRDAEGNVHFIPNGKIDSVTNMTHGWSRAIIEVGIAYKENADFVMQILTELAFELKQDTMFGPFIIDDPEMLGVDSLGDSAVTLKLMIKTRTFKQWQVKREMLRRIKRRFDELGIEIPYPHRTVFHRHEHGLEEMVAPARPKLAA